MNRSSCWLQRREVYLEMNRQIEVFPNQPRDSGDQLSHELLAEEGKLFANIVLKYILSKISRH